MKWLIGAVLSVAVITLSLNIYLQPNDFQLCPSGDIPTSAEGCGAADAIVSISGGDTDARTDHAIAMYKNGWAPVLIFSGAAQDKTGPSNALAMAKRAVAAGVPSSAIILEQDAENTKQNAQNTKQLLAENNVKSVILVTSGYHQRRASLEFDRITAGDGVTVRNSPTNDKDWNGLWWATPRGWWLATGEFSRIIALQFEGFTK